MKTDSFDPVSSAPSSTKVINAKRAFLNVFSNVAVMAVIAIAVNLMLRLDVYYFGNSMPEFSFTEVSQLVCLTIAFGCFARIAHHRPDLKHVAALACGLFAVMFIREMDNTLDTITHGFWKYPALVAAGLAISYAYSAKERIVNQMAVMATSHGVNLVVSGIVLLVVFSRLFGTGSFWQAVMGEDYVRMVKSIAEEGAELLCYSLIAFASVKALLGFKTK
ncbi:MULTISPECIES: hypothetical protein [unclassified Vibrio]|uniref:hypothetical protein n=1 Tax=unclassified Vibrio TaxID=2614977 RepID=UPI001360BEE3|nr:MULTISPECIES: hypothetical protein [unclassified Vibrio]NAW56001.1 hypothetical protein [Vibrio sp. V36_P2S2PM302]NAX26580.1 hypothetical protein [Vibrio sp. V38_P2S17PM301]NAX32340.1 hypothetical protein [Vibrio sp. V37_P2S8PM304]